MTNIIKFGTYLLFITMLISCENNPIDTQYQPNSQLISIVESFNINNAPSSAITTYTISNNLNTQIEYEGSSFQLQTFENGNMVMIEFYSNDGVMIGTDQLNYDSSDRLTTVIKSYPLQNYVSSRTYAYENNQIVANQIDTDSNGSLLSETTYTFLLDSENRIVGYENEGNATSWEAEYSSGNLLNFRTYTADELKGEATFTYAQDIASEPYQKEAYRYGSEWRNNIMLFQGGEYAFKQLAELGENYLTGYTYTLSSDPSSEISLTVAYDFDDNNRLIRQTKNKLFFMSAHQRILTYNYEQ